LKYPDGVKIIINDNDPVDINAEISGPDETPYKDGNFKVKLLIPNDFPLNPPKGNLYNFKFRLIINLKKIHIITI